MFLPYLTDVNGHVSAICYRQTECSASVREYVNCCTSGLCYSHYFPPLSTHTSYARTTLGVKGGISFNLVICLSVSVTYACPSINKQFVSCVSWKVKVRKIRQTFHEYLPTCEPGYRFTNISIKLC